MAKNPKIQPLRLMHYGPPPEGVIRERHLSISYKGYHDKLPLQSEQYPYVSPNSSSTFGRLPFRDWMRDWGWNAVFYKKDDGWWGNRVWQNRDSFLVNTNSRVGGSGPWNSWQSGPPDNNTTDVINEFGGWWNDWGYMDPPLWGTGSQVTGGLNVTYFQTRTSTKLPVYFGNGDDDTDTHNEMEGDEYGCHGIYCLFIADIDDSSGGFANWGFNHAYCLYRSDAEETDFTLWEQWRDDILYTLTFSYTNPQLESSGFRDDLHIPNTASGIRLLQYITTAMRRGRYWNNNNSLILNLRETGKCSPRDIWEWFKALNYEADPWGGQGFGINNIQRYYIQKIDYIIEFLRDAPNNDIFIEMQYTDKNSETQAGDYSWPVRDSKFYIGEIGVYEKMVVHFMRLRSNGAMFDFDSDGSGGVLGYKRQAQINHVTPWFGLSPDNKYGIVNGQRTMKVLQPFASGVNPRAKNSRNKKYCYGDHRAYPFSADGINTFEYPNTDAAYKAEGNEHAYDERIYKTYVPDGTDGGSEDGYMEVKGYTN